MAQTGKTQSHMLRMLLLTGISMLIDKNMDVPALGRLPRSGVLVSLPSVVSSAKVELYNALRARGVRKAERARRMGIHKQQVERLTDLDHTSRIEQLEAAFAALGMRLTVDIREAA
jgi:antitoxin HicB